MGHSDRERRKGGTAAPHPALHRGPVGSYRTQHCCVWVLPRGGWQQQRLAVGPFRLPPVPEKPTWGSGCCYWHRGAAARLLRVWVIEMFVTRALCPLDVIYQWEGISGGNISK